MLRTFCFVFLTASLASTAAAQTADSIADFAPTQGSGNWFYGIYEQGASGGTPHGYTTSAFVELDVFDAESQTWSASDALVGANNNEFLRLDAEGGHPTGLGPGNQDTIIWAVRRYVAPTAGVARIEIDLRKKNIENSRGGGITGRIFVDGVEIFTQLIENLDGVGVQQSLLSGVAAGSPIDLALDPTGLEPAAGFDGLFSARADGSAFSATIAIIPEPGICCVVLTGLLSMGVCGPKHRWV